MSRLPNITLADNLFSFSITAPATIKVFQLLLEYWKEEDKPYQQFLAVLAEDTNLSIISVRRALKELKRQGLILKYLPKKKILPEKRYGDGGLYLRNIPLEIRPTIKAYDRAILINTS